MSINLSALQKQRRDTAANWTAENPTLLDGEIGLESDTGYWKVGDGATTWTSLAYVTGLGAEIPVSRLADGTARQLLQTAANGTDVEWTSNVDVPGTLDVTGVATFDSKVTINADLEVTGTTTTIDTQNLIVEDKNVIIGNVTSPTDVTADGGGITLKGTTDKTINWVDATDAWTLSEHVNIASGKEYRIAGTKVLDATSLGSAVVSSSLTSVGTIGTGTWQGTTVATGYGGTGQTTYTDGQLLIGKTDGTLAKSTITQGTGVTITNGDGSITISATGTGGTVTNVTGTAPISVANGTTTPAISIASASTSAAGAVQLTDSTSSTSTTTAATPNAVKSAYDLANAALPKAGGTVTGDVTLNAQSDLRFADSDSSNWVAFQAPATVASNVTWTLPNADGTNGQVLASNGSGVLSWVTKHNYQEFTSSGTWTKPSDVTTVLVEIIGAGAGGASGARYATTSQRTGGGGGAGGARVERIFAASDLTSTVTVTVGAAGTGGAAVTTDSTNGNPGTNAGDTTFGTYLTSGVATGGTGGSTGPATTALCSFRVLNFSTSFAFGVVGSPGGANSASNGNNSASTLTGGAGGAGGAGANASTTTTRTGGTGGYNARLTTTGTVTPAGSNATANEGGGGGGGGYTTATTGVAGGNGAFPGGGGGGGSAADNGFASGKGGDGGAGIVRVWSW